MIKPFNGKCPICGSEDIEFDCLDNVNALMEHWKCKGCRRMFDTILKRFTDYKGGE